MLKYVQYSQSTADNHTFTSRFQPIIFYLRQTHSATQNIIFIIVVLILDIIFDF